MLDLPCRSMTTTSSARPSSRVFSITSRSVLGAAATARGADFVRGMAFSSFLPVPLLAPASSGKTGTDLCCRAGVQPREEERPDRRREIGQLPGLLLRYPTAREAPRRRIHQPL